MILCVAALAALCAIVGTDRALAQGEPYLELLRSDIQANKVAILTEAMQLTDEQGEKFWPIYREFQTELAKLGDERIAMIKDFAANYGSLSEDQARQISKTWFSLERRNVDLLQKTHDKIAKELGYGVAGRFVQVENLVQQLIRVRLSAEMPIYPETVPAK
jgi:hypothetical protein